MKYTKFALIAALILVSLNLMAFDGFIPASELSGRYLKFSTYYQKTFGNFEDGFDEMGFMVAKPSLYKKWGLEADVITFGDDVYKKTQFYLSPGYHVTPNFTIAVSAGLMRTDLDQNELMFAQEEILDNYNKTVPLFGASAHANLFDRRVKLGVGLYNINEPDIAFNDTVEDKLPYKIVANLEWRVTSWLKLTPWYKLENDESYYGLNVGVSIPDETFTANVGASGEKISVTPEINTMNYWNFKVGYDYHLEDDLQGTNYFIFASYEFADAGEPEISYRDENWNNKYYETQLRTVPLQFEVKNVERLRVVSVYADEQELLYQRNLREYDAKEFALTIDTKPGITKVKVFVEGLSEDTYEHEVDLAYTDNSISMQPVPQVIMNEQEVSLAFNSTVINGAYNIDLYHNGQQMLTVNTTPITRADDDAAYQKQYSTSWVANGIEDGPGHIYYFKVSETTRGFEANSNEFTGDLTPKVYVLRFDELPAQVANNTMVQLSWHTDVPEAGFDLYLFENGIRSKKLNDARINIVKEQGELNSYGWDWPVKDLKNRDEYTYTIKLVEYTTGMERQSNRFTSDFAKPKPPEPPKNYMFQFQPVPSIVENNTQVTVGWVTNVDKGDIELGLLENGLEIQKLGRIAADGFISKDGEQRTFAWNWTVSGLKDGRNYALKLSGQNAEAVSNSFKLKEKPAPVKVAPKVEPKSSSAIWWILLLIVVAIVIFIIVGKRKKRR